MTDKQRTCGDCAWFQLRGNAPDKICTCPCSTDCEVMAYNVDSTDATECPTFRSPSDQALIDECHKLRSLGAAVEWSKINRLVEIAAGKELEGKKRCDFCGGNGVDGYEPNGDRVDCHICQGTGYKKGGE